MIFKIIITQQHTIKCFICEDKQNSTETNKNEIPIELIPQIQEYPATIEFINNDINFFATTSTSISFLKEWIDSPTNFKKYNFVYQGKEYSVIAEVFFALIINEFKKKVTKDHIISKFEIELQFSNKKVMNRMLVALETIDLSGMEYEIPDYEYDEQGDYLREIFSKKDEYDQFKRTIERAKLLIENIPTKKERLQIDEEKTFDSNTAYEFGLRFSTKEKTALKMCRLDNYCVFIASRYFDSLLDHINLSFVSKKYRFNMEKFHYNPISLTQDLLFLFPNIETFHLYKPFDEYLKGGRIQHYVDWRQTNYYKTIQSKNKTIDYKFPAYEKVDRIIDENKKRCIPYLLTIPSTVKCIDKEAFDQDNLIISIIIPPNVSFDKRNCLKKCQGLKSINLKLDPNEFILGNCVFTEENQQLDISIVLPSTVSSINYKYYNQTSIVVPSTITSFKPKCFEKYKHLYSIQLPESFTSFDKYSLEGVISLKDIVLPSTISDLAEDSFDYLNHLRTIRISNQKASIPKKTFMWLDNLKVITLPLNETRVVYGNKIFSNTPLFDQSIILPKSVNYINFVPSNPLTELTIPSYVTSFTDDCFKKCESIKILHLPETIQNYYPLLLTSLYNLTELSISPEWTFKKQKLFRTHDGILSSISLPTSIQKINKRYVKIESLSTFEIPSDVTRLGKYCFADCEYLSDVKKLRQVRIFEKNCFLKCPCLKKDLLKYANENEIEDIPQLSENNKNQLEEWTGLKCLKIIFNSETDQWDYTNQTLNESIIHRKNLLFVIEDNDGEIFGYFLNSKIEGEQHHNRIPVDVQSFQFNLQSTGNRLSGPMKFELKDKQNGGYQLYGKGKWSNLITLGDIWLYKQSKENDCVCEQHNEWFDYHGIENALCGKTTYDHPFYLKRFFVIQMK